MTLKATVFPAVLTLAALAAAAPSNLREPAIGSAVTYDARSFRVGKRRVILSCGGLHYFRILPDDWRDRLHQTRLAGFNMIETPVPWSLHEPAKGGFRFDGAADLEAFLKLCHEMGLLVLLRIGPYVNATLSNGGLPAWLGDDPKLLVRSTNDRFMQAARAWWSRLIPLIAKQQAPAGPVALVQIEDHYGGPDRRYLARLLEEARAKGIRVPIVLSDLNPCKNIDRFQGSDTRVFATTELLPDPPLKWGERRRAFQGMDNILFTGLAKGLDGYNHSMWAAGTNLEVVPACTYPTRFEATTTGLLEAGGLSDVAADLRKVNWFARTFESVLAASTTLRDHPLLKGVASSKLIVYGRGDGRTAILFLKPRYGEGSVALSDPATGISTTVATSAGSPCHVVADYPITPKTTLALSTAQIYARHRLAGREVLVVYAPVGSESVMAFRAERKPTVVAGGGSWTWDEKRKLLVLRWKCGEKGVRTDFVAQADVPLHIVALEESQTATTWMLGEGGILIGVPRIGEWKTGEKPDIELRVPARRIRYALTYYPPGDQKKPGELKGLVEPKYDAKAKRIDFRIELAIIEPIPAFLRRWEMADTMAEAEPGFDDAKWADSVRPMPLGEGRYGWYRCTFNSPRGGNAKLLFKNVADSATLYLNGQFIRQGPTKRIVDGPRAFIHPTDFAVSLKRGENVAAALVRNWGQYTNATIYGEPLGKQTAWGVVDEVLAGGRPVARWRRREGIGPVGRTLAWGKVVKTASPIRWYRVSFRVRKHPAHHAPRLRARGLSYGTLWVNGHFAGHYHQQGFDAGQGYRLPSQWLGETNEIIALEEGGREPRQAEVRFDARATYLPLHVQFE